MKAAYYSIHKDWRTADFQEDDSGGLGTLNITQHPDLATALVSLSANVAYPDITFPLLRSWSSNIISNGGSVARFDDDVAGMQLVAPGAQPALVTSPSGNLNGVRCGGSSYLQTPTNLDLPHPLVVGAVVQVETINGQSVFADWPGAPYASVNGSQVKLDLGGTDAQGTSVALGDVFSFVGVVRATGESALYVNDTQAATGPAGAALDPPDGPISIGAVIGGSATNDVTLYSLFFANESELANVRSLVESVRALA